MQRIYVEDRSLSENCKVLRKKGLIPGVLYGRDFPSTPIQAHAGDIRGALKRYESLYEVMSAEGILYVKLEDIQRNVLTRELLHFTLVQQDGRETNERPKRAEECFYRLAMS